jgi:predicted dehydrogenase
MQPDSAIGVGIIGLGVRGLDSIARNMATLYPETKLKITALCDRNPERIDEAQDYLQARYAHHGTEIKPTLYINGRDLIDDAAVELIIITSITDTHREFAVPALRSGKKVYCDKPLAHNAEDAIAIVEAETATKNELIMGFTRRYESTWVKAYQLLQDGVIGDLAMIQVRNIIPYHRYLTAWWRRRAWSGGALNDKGSHIFDVFNWFSGSRAQKVQGFGGRLMVQTEPDGPQRCHTCDRDCPYRRRSYETGLPITPDLMMHASSSWLQESEEKHIDDICVYAPGSDLYHNGSIHFSYQNGVIASYFYTIFGPPAKDEETLELVGNKGRIILTRHTGELDIVSDFGRTHQVLDCRDENFSDSHFGADIALVKELSSFCHGSPPTVSAQAGLEATRMVMAALKSMDSDGLTIPLTDIPNVRI